MFSDSSAEQQNNGDTIAVGQAGGDFKKYQTTMKPQTIATIIALSLSTFLLAVLVLLLALRTIPYTKETYCEYDLAHCFTTR